MLFLLFFIFFYFHLFINFFISFLPFDFDTIILFYNRCHSKILNSFQMISTFSLISVVFYEQISKCV